MTAIHERRDTQDEVITARRVPVHVALAPSEDDGGALHGWVNCPLKGHMALETCSVCPYSQGVRITATGSAPEVLCGWLPATRPA